MHPSYEISFDLISEYIDSHYFEELTVEKLAAMCNMSHSTFSMNFYRRYNMTCKEYITATRINAAENMLLFPVTMFLLLPEKSAIRTVAISSGVIKNKRNHTETGQKNPGRKNK